MVTPPSPDDSLLSVTGLVKHFPARAGLLSGRRADPVRAVDGVDLTLRRGRTLGLVGESGCGKTTTGRLVVRLLEPTAGRIVFDGTDVTHLGRRALRPLRQRIQIIFQDPYSSLNPRHTVGRIVAMPLVVNRIRPAGGVRARVQELLEIVGLNPEHYNRYPHEFSGGQRQRIGIARALAVRPDVVVADEPVSALDVSIQAQIVNLLRSLQDEFQLTFLFIAHDLAVVRHFCHDVAVMYLGRIVEVGDRDAVYRRPAHPYTKALLAAVPDVATPRAGRARVPLTGEVGSTDDTDDTGTPSGGCRFRARCPTAQSRCTTEEPQLRLLPTGQHVACHFPDQPAS